MLTELTKNQLTELLERVVSRLSEFGIKDNAEKILNENHIKDLVLFFIRDLKEKNNDSESTFTIQTKFYNQLLKMGIRLNFPFNYDEIMEFYELFIVEFYRHDFQRDLLDCIQYKRTAKDLSEAVKKRFKEISHHEEEANKLLKEIEIYKKEVELLATKNALSGFRILYETLRKSQQHATHLWLLATLGMFSVCLCVLYGFFQNNKEIDPSIHIPFLMIFSEISITLCLIIITAWCAKMYSLSRSLSINYSHKAVSSTALLPFMKGINNDEIKDTVLLEASRMIFATPDVELSKNGKLDLKILETIKDINPIVKHVIDNNSTKKTNNDNT